MSEELKSTLLALPDNIAEMATKILELQTDKSVLDVQIAEIETAVKFQVGTDINLKNDTARRGAIQDMLS
ncbi:MAG: hypothetical protein WC623_21705 [Pedobacter sp.]|uniref:hypothetical protein n=1 Tax=Pedobacter sp. TaxID=1411316 RepID=UPI0035667BC3